MAKGNLSKPNLMSSYLVSGLLDIVNVLCTSTGSLVRKKSYLHYVFEQQVIQGFASVVEGMKFLVQWSVGTQHSCGNWGYLKDKVTEKKCCSSSSFVPGCSENTETNQLGLQDQGSNPPVTLGGFKPALPGTEEDGFAVTKGIQQPSRDWSLPEGSQAIGSLKIQW